jgi:hypothetical protein
MDQLEKVHRTHVRLMQYTCQSLGHILQFVSQEVATQFRDGPEGWTILEVVCHLRDFDGFFHHRAMMMLEQEYPHLPAYDHEALAIEHNYNGQNLGEVYAELAASRQRFVTFFKALTPDQWERAGIHPERGHFTMTDAVMQVGHHEANHIEQITRILTQSLP